MTLYWTIISNELTQKSFCPTGVHRNLFDPTVLQHRTGSSDICKNGWYLLLRRTIQ